MASSPETKCKTAQAAEATLAKVLAPEEIRAGDFVTPLFMIAEMPSYWWRCDEWSLPHDQPVRIRFTATSEGLPLKVTSICLPFVLTKTPAGDLSALDLRTCQLARLDTLHAKRAWKAYKKAARRKRAAPQQTT